MTNQSFAAPSVLLTHWDPDLYPAEPLPFLFQNKVDIYYPFRFRS
jgi:hypothetical protein